MKPTTKIEALNYLHTQAPLALAELNQILSPYIGKKVEKADPWDKWIAKLSPQISAFQDSLRQKGIRALFRFSAHHISLTMDTTVPSGEYSVDYVEIYFAVAKLSGDTLETVFQPESLSLRSDYTEAEIAEKQQRIAQLRAEAYQLEGEIPVQLRK